ncbi:transglycosylase family protein [Saccharopolyspora griseoalba]|uniref:Transglycosylase family protein n=1 Tax=Saccharopolyspora griseoalba TaxID=1431848 RepID=A0ABW2LK42_9PSEU
MNGRGEPSHSGLAPQQDNGYWADSFDASTDWFTPVQPTQQHTMVGLLDAPDGQAQTWDAEEHPSFPPGALDITAADVYEALGPDAEDMLATAEVDVNEVIALLNAETVVLPPLDFTELEPEAEPGLQPQRTQTEAITAWKRRFLKGAVAGVLLSLTGSGAAAAAMDKSVTVEVDGKEKTVSTYDDTVGEVLKDEGINVGPHDALSPSPQAEVGHGDKITLDRGRLLKLNIDGEVREEWVRSGTVGQALSALNVNTEGAWISADRSTAVPEDGMELKVRTLKDVTVTDGAGEPKQLTTHAANIGELVKELKLDLGPQDKITPGGDAKIVDGAQIDVDRISSKVVSLTIPVEPPVKEIVDENMLKGEEKVVDPGEAGEKIQFTRITTVNGEEDSRDVVDEKITKQAREKVVRVGGKEPPNSGVWDKLVQCESTGNWSINSGNGYYGGLQFDKQTWDAYGGDQYAEYPHQASREQQIAVAEKVRDARGGSYGAWPACASKLGLPT